jgi:hypothetical protein
VLGDGAFRPIETSKKYARRFANPVGNHRSVLQLQLERGLDRLLRHVE